VQVNDLESELEEERSNARDLENRTERHTSDQLRAEHDGDMEMMEEAHKLELEKIHSQHAQELRRLQHVMREALNLSGGGGSALEMAKAAGINVADETPATPTSRETAVGLIGKRAQWLVAMATATLLPEQRQV